MKVELKNVKFSEHMSEETNAFTADVYVDGKKCGYAKNDGHGGCTNVQDYGDPGLYGIMQMAENYLRTQPDINIGTEAKPFMVKSNFENVVDQLFEQWLQNKEVKKFEKKMVNHLMWGIPAGTSYTQMRFVKPLNQIDRDILQQFLDKYKKTFKEGEKYLNTNLVGFDL